MQNGYLKEDEFVENLNNKKVCDLSGNAMLILESLFGPLDRTETITCVKTQNCIKPDFEITYKNEKKFLSLKSGNATELHKERLDTFIEFLKQYGYSQRVIDSYLLFHYGDGTTNGSGDHVMDYDEAVYRFREEIKYLNIELNKDKEFVKDFMMRIMFDGVVPDADKADAVYHGDIDNGIMVTRNQVLQYLDVKRWDFYQTLHIGPVFIRPYSRYASYKNRHEEDHHEKISCRWSRIEPDFNYINRRFRYYTRKYR